MHFLAVNHKPNSFLNESLLQQVDTYSKLTVFAYIHHQQQNNNNMMIPKLITYIILSFYTDIKDEFNPLLCGNCIEVANWI